MLEVQEQVIETVLELLEHGASAVGKKIKIIAGATWKLLAQRTLSPEVPEELAEKAKVETIRSTRQLIRSRLESILRETEWQETFRKASILIGWSGVVSSVSFSHWEYAVMGVIAALVTGQMARMRGQAAQKIFDESLGIFSDKPGREGVRKVRQTAEEWNDIDAAQPVTVVGRLATIKKNARSSVEKKLKGDRLIKLALEAYPSRKSKIADDKLDTISKAPEKVKSAKKPRRRIASKTNDTELDEELLEIMKQKLLEAAGVDSDETPSDGDDASAAMEIAQDILESVIVELSGPQEVENEDSSTSPSNPAPAQESHPYAAQKHMKVLVKFFSEPRRPNTPVQSPDRSFPKAQDMRVTSVGLYAKRDRTRVRHHAPRRTQ